MVLRGIYRNYFTFRGAASYRVMPKCDITAFDEEALARNRPRRISSSRRYAQHTNRHPEKRMACIPGSSDTIKRTYPPSGWRRGKARNQSFGIAAPLMLSRPRIKYTRRKPSAAPKSEGNRQRRCGQKIHAVIGDSATFTEIVDHAYRAQRAQRLYFEAC